MTTALEYWTRVLRDRPGFLDRSLAMLERHAVRYCIVGDAAINAYAEPVFTRRIELAIDTHDTDRAIAMLGEHFAISRDALSATITEEGSDLVLVIERDPRFGAFVDRSVSCELLERYLPVAGAEDLLRSRLWRWPEPSRSPVERAKLVYDVARLVEAFPHFEDLVPDDLRQRLRA